VHLLGLGAGDGVDDGAGRGVDLVVPAEEAGVVVLPDSLVTPASLSVSMFCWASMLKTNSLPRRRAGSPVHASAGPSTAKLTPARWSSSAMALVVRLARSSRAPAQPTQKRYSTSSGMRPSSTRVCEPKKRDRRPSRCGSLRSRMTVNVMMPASTPVANRSSMKPIAAQWPIPGIANVRENSAP
jgi:hypothetical protein